MHSLFVDIVALGVLTVAASMAYYKIRSKAKQIVAEIPNSIDLVGNEQELADAQQAAFEKVIRDQTLPIAAVGSTFSILGNAGLAFAPVFLTGVTIGATVADLHGDYLFEDLTPGNYLVVPQAQGHVFKPDFRALRIVDADATGVDFEDPSSVVDSRQAVLGFGPGANGSRTLNGTLIYDVQTSSNSNIPPTDCRVNKPVGCSSLPQNSRK